MSDTLIALAIARTTGKGDPLPYLYRVVSWLTATYGSYPGIADNVRDYFTRMGVSTIAVLDFPKVSTKGWMD